MKRRFPIRRLWEELRRRHVVRVGLYYAVFGWVLIQVADVLLEAFDLSHLLRYVIAGVVGAFPVAVALSWMFDITSEGVERTAPLPPAAEAPSGSLAVLPFANLSEDSENEYFSDGLSEEIRNQLSAVPGLKVAARTSSFAFKGRHEDAREIGRRLNVAAILEGGVRKQAGVVRISLQLVNTADGFQVWSEHFERQLEDIFGLQREIAEAVTHIVTPLSGASPASSVGGAPRNFDAFNLYLRGRHYFHKRTDAALRRSVGYFEQAIELDPDYARAHAGLSDAWILLTSRYYGNLSREETVARALPAAQRALQLSPGLAEAHASLGLVQENQGDLDAAAKSLRRALQLNPGYTMALVWYGLVLVHQARFQEAAQCNLDALQLDPLSPIINVNVGFDALRRGDIEQARSSFLSAIEIDPDFPVSHYGLARAHAQSGDFHAAREEIEQSIRTAPDRGFYFAHKALILLQAGDNEGAARAIEDACCMTPDNLFHADLVIAHHISRGDREALQRVADGRGGQSFSEAHRAQAFLALGSHDRARELYEASDLDVETEMMRIVTDDFVWRLPHLINRAHLRLAEGDGRGEDELRELISAIARFDSQGVKNPLAYYWAATATSLLGRTEEARARMTEARAVGWSHAWWERLDWNASTLAPEA